MTEDVARGTALARRLAAHWHGARRWEQQAGCAGEPVRAPDSEENCEPERSACRRYVLPLSAELLGPKVSQLGQG